MKNIHYIALMLLILPFPLLAKRVTTKDGKALKEKPSKAWGKLLDPTTTEFWQEGRHIPDAGFLIWAKEPTLKNAKCFLLRMHKKRERIHIMVEQQERANKELLLAGKIADDYNFLAAYAKDEAKKIPQSTQIFVLFSPECKYCKRQIEALKSLTHLYPMQVSGKKLHHFEGAPRSTWASEEDRKKYVKGALPVTLIYSPAKNTLTSLEGFRSLREVVMVGKKLEGGSQ